MKPRLDGHTTNILHNAIAVAGQKRYEICIQDVLDGTASRQLLLDVCLMLEREVFPPVLTDW